MNFHKETFKHIILSTKKSFLNSLKSSFYIKLTQSTRQFFSQEVQTMFHLPHRMKFSTHYGSLFLLIATEIIAISSFNENLASGRE